MQFPGADNCCQCQIGATRWAHLENITLLDAAACPPGARRVGNRIGSQRNWLAIAPNSRPAVDADARDNARGGAS